MITWMTEQQFMQNGKALKDKELLAGQFSEDFLQVHLTYPEAEVLLNFPAEEAPYEPFTIPGPQKYFYGFAKNAPVALRCDYGCVPERITFEMQNTTPHNTGWQWTKNLSVLKSIDPCFFKKVTWVSYSQTKIQKYCLHREGEVKTPIYFSEKMDDALELREALRMLGNQDKLEISVTNPKTL